MWKMNQEQVHWNEGDTCRLIGMEDEMITFSCLQRKGNQWEWVSEWVSESQMLVNLEQGNLARKILTPVIPKSVSSLGTQQSLHWAFKQEYLTKSRVYVGLRLSSCSSYEFIWVMYVVVCDSIHGRHCAALCSFINRLLNSCQLNDLRPQFG